MAASNRNKVTTVPHFSKKKEHYHRKKIKNQWFYFPHEGGVCKRCLSTHAYAKYFNDGKPISYEALPSQLKAPADRDYGLPLSARLKKTSRDLPCIAVLFPPPLPPQEFTKDYFSQIRMLTGSTARYQTINRTLSRNINLVESEAQKSLAPNVFNQFSKTLYDYVKALSDSRKSTDRTDITQQMQIKKIEFLRKANYLLHGHGKTLLKLILGLSTALLAFYLTGGLDLTHTAITEGFSAAAAVTTKSQVASIGITTAISAFAGGQWPVRQMGYAAARGLGFFAAEEAASACADAIYDAYKPKKKLC